MLNSSAKVDVSIQQAANSYFGDFGVHLRIIENSTILCKTFGNQTGLQEVGNIKDAFWH